MTLLSVTKSNLIKEMIDFKSAIFALVFGVSSLYLNEWVISISWLATLGITTWVYHHGLFSTKALKKRIYQWILEQKQERNLPIIEKCNIFGQSAAEVGTIHRKGDLLLELPQNGENSLVFHMADVNDGSWMVLKITIHDNQKVAQVEFLWFTQNVVYQIAQASKSCHVEKTQSAIKIGYIQLMVLEPLRRLRILFNGIMK